MGDDFFLDEELKVEEAEGGLVSKDENTHAQIFHTKTLLRREE